MPGFHKSLLFAAQLPITFPTAAGDAPPPLPAGVVIDGDAPPKVDDPMIFGGCSVDSDHW